MKALSWIVQCTQLFIDMTSFVANFFTDPKHQPFLFRLAVALYIAVLALGSIPGARAEVGEVASGLVLHFFTYAVIAVCLFGGLAGSAARKACMTVIAIAAMGGLDEFIQGFFPYRSATAIDWMVDMSAGVLTSIVLWKIVQQNAVSRSAI